MSQIIFPASNRDHKGGSARSDAHSRSRLSGRSFAHVASNRLKSQVDGVSVGASSSRLKGTTDSVGDSCEALDPAAEAAVSYLADSPPCVG